MFVLFGKAMPSFDAFQFRQLLGSYMTGVTVVTTRDVGAVGVTINSFTSVSLDPPLILFCLDKNARRFAAFEKAEHFVVNILAAEQERLSRAFAAPQQPELAASVYATDIENCPVLRDTLGWLYCRKFATHQGGDHLIFIGEVLRIHHALTLQKPLIYFKGDYHALAT